MFSYQALRPSALISAGSNRVVSDAALALAWPRKSLVLQPKEGASASNDFFSTLHRDPEGICRSARIGRSITHNLHPVGIAALVDLLEQHAHSSSPRQVQPLPQRTSDCSRHLADWLFEVSGNTSPYQLKNSVGYLFTSGARRARIIATALKNLPHRQLDRIVDVGCGVGMISWLLRHDFPSIRAVDLLEPRTQNRPATDHLWRNSENLSEYTITNEDAEHAEFRPSDMIMFCHCLHLIAPEQRGLVLQRAWAALNPGGVLLVNEMAREAGRATPAHNALIPRDMIVSLMPGTTRLFTSRTEWKWAHTPEEIQAKALDTSSLFVSVRQD